MNILFTRVFLLASLLTSLLTNTILGEMDVFFSPEKDIRELLLDNIARSNTSINVALSALSSGELVLALSKAKERGVKISVILDEKGATVEPSLADFLREEGLEVKTLKGKAGGLMNSNFAIFDEERLITGSYSWTERAQRFNLENVVFIDDPAVVALYLKEFDRLYGEERKEAPIPALGGKESKRPSPGLEPPTIPLNGREFIDVTVESLDATFGPETALPPGEKKRLWEDYKGKYVRWRGIVTYIGAGRMYWNRIGFRHKEGTTETDAEVVFNSEYYNKIMLLKEGDYVTYTARLYQRRGYGSPYRLDDGAPVEE